MKKKIAKIVTVTLVLLFTFSTGVYANKAYQRWAGSEEYEQTKLNLTSFESSYDSLFATKEQLVTEKANMKNELAETKTALATAESNNTLIKTERDSLLTKVDGLNTNVTKLKADLDVANNKINDTDLLYGEVKTRLKNLIVEVNKSNGKGNRYDKLAVKVNELAGYVGIEDRVSDKVGNGSNSSDLEQAEKDMTDLETKSNALLKKIEGKE